MGDQIKRKSFSIKLLIFLQAFLGLGAIFGGTVLIIDPSGELIQMPATMLEHSPFSDFLLPGIILLTLLGILPLAVAYGLVKNQPLAVVNRLNLFSDKHWAWTYSLYIGFVLIIWIAVEAYFIQGFAVIHLGYIFWALLIQAITLLPSVQSYYTSP
ncbi:MULTISPECIES: hypothetical protein [Desulfitobacterium]|uniref:Uncharacterized protein n=1 Tax=Desulfitobacterium dehalogenans (strain ATCC 51507 / DSM 9161 / JW/IU-DC1) TaxID=756499 RepID=I4A6N6_DESDJ|nr:MULTISPECIES: hypothetical protein [Desulfitobacterium]AFL99620.1 hypothetical protein Desde_1191 [Desulfitobacterium dehalogenans ATCC 51507]